MNKRLKRYIVDCSCAIIYGDRGAGKSTLFALIIEEAKKLGYDVYCQYPYIGCKQLPLEEYKVNGVIKKRVNKKFLYTADLTHSYIFIDEAKTVWNARDFKSWGVEDEDFFNMLRHNDIHVFLATQAYDMLDLNVRRAADYTFKLCPLSFNRTGIEMSKSVICKVADRNAYIVDHFAPGNAEVITNQICDVYITRFKFWRKPYYNKFFTHYTFDEKPKIDVENWEDIIKFPESKKKRKRFIFVEHNKIAVNEEDSAASESDLTESDEGEDTNEYTR